jgi:hypothetical protein
MLIGADMGFDVGMGVVAGAAAFPVDGVLAGAGGRSAFVTATLSFETGMACFSWALAVNVIPTRAVMTRTTMIRFIG